VAAPIKHRPFGLAEGFPLFYQPQPRGRPPNIEHEYYEKMGEYEPFVGKVITVSAETVNLVNELVQAVSVEDWLDEAVEVDAIH
jgi:hypothetical protein